MFSVFPTPARKSTALLSMLVLVPLLGGCLKEMEPRPIFTPTPETPTQTPAEPSPTEVEQTTVTPRPPTPTAVPTATPEEPTPTRIPTPTPDPEDPDGDGYTVDGGDCAPYDSTRHPGAMEIPLDGIDSNCDGIQDLIENIAGPKLNEGGDKFKARLDSPSSVERDDDGTLYVGMEGQCRIRRVKDGKTDTIVGTGQCAQSYQEDNALPSQMRIGTILDLQLDKARGLLYFVERVEVEQYTLLRTLDLETNEIQTVAGGGTADLVDGMDVEDANLQFITQIFRPSEAGFMYLTLGTPTFSYNTDDTGDSIWKLTDGGKLYRIAGNGTCTYDSAVFDLKATATTICQPDAVWSEPDGSNIHILAPYLISNRGTSYASYVARIDESGTLRWLAGKDPGYYNYYGCDDPETYLPAPVGTSPDPAENYLCAVEDIEVQPSGQVLFVDGCLIRSISTSGQMSYTVGTIDCLDLNHPLDRNYFENDRLSDIDIINSGLVLAADRDNGLITEVALDGSTITTQAGALMNVYGGDVMQVSEAVLNSPSGFARRWDAVTQEDVYYFIEEDQYVIREWRGDTIRRIAGVPGTYESYDVPDDGPALTTTIAWEAGRILAADDNGVVYFRDYNTIKRIKDNNIDILIGAGQQPLADGLQARDVIFTDKPDALIVDPQGTWLYFDHEDPEATGTYHEALWGIELTGANAGVVRRLSRRCEEQDTTFVPGPLSQTCLTYLGPGVWHNDGIAIWGGASDTSGMLRIEGGQVVVTHPDQDVSRFITMDEFGRLVGDLNDSSSLAISDAEHIFELTSSNLNNYVMQYQVDIGSTWDGAFTNYGLLAQSDNKIWILDRTQGTIWQISL